MQNLGTTQRRRQCLKFRNMRRIRNWQLFTRVKNVFVGHLFSIVFIKNIHPTIRNKICLYIIRLRYEKLTIFDDRYWQTLNVNRCISGDAGGNIKSAYFVGVVIFEEQNSVIFTHARMIFHVTGKCLKWLCIAFYIMYVKSHFSGLAEIPYILVPISKEIEQTIKIHLPMSLIDPSDRYYIIKSTAEYFEMYFVLILFL